MALTSAEKMRAKRERAREAGLCIVCGKRKPRKGKATCKACNDAAKIRVKNSREK